MSEAPGPSPQAVEGEAVPVLPRGVRLHRDEIRGTTVLLAPERTLALDPVAVAIVGAIDGTRSFDAIVDALAAEYGAPRDTIARDVGAFLRELADRRMLEFRA